METFGAVALLNYPRSRRVFMRAAINRAMGHASLLADLVYEEAFI
jgi:hypothetical protein